MAFELFTSAEVINENDSKNFVGFVNVFSAQQIFKPVSSYIPIALLIGSCKLISSIDNKKVTNWETQVNFG